MASVPPGPGSVIIKREIVLTSMDLPEPIKNEDTNDPFNFECVFDDCDYLENSHQNQSLVQSQTQNGQQHQSFVDKYPLYSEDGVSIQHPFFYAIGYRD